ncbi:chaperonin GroEL, partial [Candidatus Saccharibacteria bacterium]|nr:chaperonin GroEL [Candidatus Saccharibacteria bacterium]
GNEWIPQIAKSKSGKGIDVNNPTKLVDLKEKGVIDPTRVVKEAIQNAASIAGTAMTMGALVVEVPEKTPAAPMPDMGGMGMGI